MWDQSGGYVDSNLKYAGDLELWVRFFRHARLHSVEAPLGGFRIRRGQLSVENMSKYLDEAVDVIDKEVTALSRHELKKLKHVKSFYFVLNALNRNKIPVIDKFDSKLRRVFGQYLETAPVIRYVPLENRWTKCIT